MPEIQLFYCGEQPSRDNGGKLFEQMMSGVVRKRPKFLYAEELSSATAEVILNCGVTLRGIMQRDSPAIRQGPISRGFGRTGSRHPRLVAQGCLSPVLLTQQRDGAAVGGPVMPPGRTKQRPRSRGWALYVWLASSL